MVDRPDYGILFLNFGGVAGFLGVCIGFGGVFWDANFFLPFSRFVFSSVLGA